MHKKIKAMLILCFLAFSIFAQESDWYKRKPIKKIEFEGLEKLTSSEISGIFDSYKGKPFSDDVYLEMLNKLYELDYFSDIVPKAIPADENYSAVNLTFVVKEKASIAGYKFIGNNSIRSADLLSKMILKKGDIYRESQAIKDEQEVKNQYRTKGYEKAEISSSKTENTDNNTITIKYKIKEGKQTVVKNILFEGNKVFSAKKIQKVLITKKSRLLEAGAFQAGNLEQDKEAIKNLYGEKGFINAHVETIKKDVDTKSDSSKNLITLTYVVFEGEKYIYAGTSFIGNKVFKTEELQECITIKSGDIINMSKYRQSFGRVVDMYYENGYMSAFVDLKPVTDVASKTISFTIMINEEERSHVENIIIRGNTKTKTEVILREILLKPGDVFSKTKFVDSLRNLANLRYFSSVVPDFQQGSERNLVDLIINVEEQNTADVGFGMTFSGVSDANTFPISFFFEWNEKNLMGTGSALRAGFNAGPTQQSLKLGYTENWFLGSPLSVGFNVSATHQKLSTFSDSEYPFGIADPFTSQEEMNVAIANAHSMKYNRWTLGFGTSTAYRWFPKHATITVAGGIDFNLVKNTFNTDIYRPLDEKIRKEQQRWGLNNSFFSRVSFDGRDIIYDPSKGWFVSQQFTFFGIIPKIENEYFFRADTKTEAYATLLDYPVSEIWNLKFVLAFFTNFSFQVPLHNKPISYESKLFIDGMFTGKGWYLLGHEGIGDVLLTHGVEFRMPLAKNILSFDFFFDAAAVKPTLKDLRTLSINDYYFSFGPGLRFSIPQFPLRLMFANTFRSNNWKPYWRNGNGADWRFVLSFNIPNL